MNNDTTFHAPRAEHPFAQFVRILGKGKTGSRSFSREEAATAFAMILRGEVEPLQLGAFLMLLRVKEETGDELAGFVDACRQQMTAPPADLPVDLDWSSYAGKKHQHPWYLLSMLLLSQAGYRVFVHGSDGHTEGRLYTEQAMLELGMPVAGSWQQVQSQLADYNLSYLPLRHFCPGLHDMMQMRPLLGLRSPVNTLARMFNPLQAPASLQSIFHPAYASLHQDADILLGQPRAAVFKGDSGEVEVKPQADTQLMILNGCERQTVAIARQFADRPTAVSAPATTPLRQLWRDESHDDYGLAATLATTAAALLALGAETDTDSAFTSAQQLWNERTKGHLTPCP
jgi:anthranilate phosphoribosyltransferase